MLSLLDVDAAAMMLRYCAALRAVLPLLRGAYC